MNSSSPLASVLPDLATHVLSYLTLSECLVYSQVSKRSLRDTLPALKQRQTKQFKERHAYKPNYPSNLKPVQDIIGEEAAIALVVQPSSDKWHILPSVEERLEILHKALSNNHASKETLSNLLGLLKTTEHDPEEECESGTERDFASSLESLHSLSVPYRLYDSILLRSTLAAGPASAHNNLTVPLDKYMGDVLIAYYLMGHSIAGLVEGPTTYQKWIHALQQDKDRTALQGYRQWIYLHSTLLRTLPMKPEWLSRMRLEPCCGTQLEVSPNDGDLVTYILPPSPYFEPAMKETTELLQSLGASQRSLPRWRQTIQGFHLWMQMDTMSILRPLGFFNGVIPSLMTCAADLQTSPALLNWLQHSDDQVQWMLAVSEHAFRNQSMTLVSMRLHVAISPMGEN